MRLKEKIITIEGRKAYYWTNDNVKKPVIVLLHGFPGNHKGLLWLAEHLSSQYHLILPDLPGCGKSSRLKGAHGVEACAHWLNLFLEELSLHKVIVLGHSFGARVACEFAINKLHKVLSIILLAPVIGPDGIIGQFGIWYYKVAKFLPAKLSKMYLSNKLYQRMVFLITFKSKDKKRRYEIMSQSMQEVAQVRTATQLEMFDDLRRYNMLGSAANLQAACLVVAGRKDEVATLRLVKAFASIIKNAVLEVIEGTGHLFPIEYPEKTSHIIKAWLNK